MGKPLSWEVRNCPFDACARFSLLPFTVSRAKLSRLVAPSHELLMQRSAEVL